MNFTKLNLPQEITASELAEILRISRVTIYRKIRQGKLKGEKRNIKIGVWEWVFTREQVEDYLNEKNI